MQGSPSFFLLISFFVSATAVGFNCYLPDVITVHFSSPSFGLLPTSSFAVVDTTNNEQPGRILICRFISLINRVIRAGGERGEYYGRTLFKFILFYDSNTSTFFHDAA
jgi:hypothetical protein